MKTVKLYGELGRRFGKVFHLDVKSPAEAIRAISALVKGFQKYLIENSEPGYKIFVGKEQFDKDEINNPTSSNNIIKIIPYVVGSGGFFKVVLGAALIALSFTPFGAGWSMNVGLALVFSGVAELLFAPPIPDKTREKTENAPSYSFDGPVNTVLQGNPVPVCYGELRVGSQIISAGLYAQETKI